MMEEINKNRQQTLFNAQPIPLYIPMLETPKPQELTDQTQQAVFFNTTQQQLNFHLDHFERNAKKTCSSSKKIMPLFEGQSFPYRLWYLVNNDVYSDVIRWSPDGNYVIIVSESAFEQKVLMYATERVFKTTSMKSFVRQLNLYGFHKVQLEKDNSFLYLQNHDKSEWPDAVFGHPSFKRTRYDLIDTIKRRCKVKQNKTTEKVKRCLEQNQLEPTPVDYNNSCALHEVNNNARKGNVYIECYNQQGDGQPVMIQFPNLLPPSENSITPADQVVTSVRRNLHETEWSPATPLLASDTEETLVEESGTSNLSNPLASFCASLFQQDHGEIFKSCDE